ncbi:unnamed protein product [Alopecurus aequalis]
MPSSSSSSCSSSSSSSSSSDDDVDDPDYRINSEDEDPGYRANDPDDKKPVPMPADAQSIVSSLHTKDDVDAVCKKYRVPKDHYTARPAGDLRASSSPPPGTVCVYAHALEAGMRVPLHQFFCDVLAHFGIAPAQLAPNGWHIMAGFVVLCYYAGVPPSLAVFRHFFHLLVFNKKKKGGWYIFHTRDTSGLRFAGLPDSIKGWKHRYFFLSSPSPWPCPVEWGVPSKSSFVSPALTGEEKRSVDTLLRVHGGAPVDIRTYLRESSLAAAKISVPSPAATPPPLLLPPSCARASAGSKGMDPSVYGMMKTILADKAGGRANVGIGQQGEKRARQRRPVARKQEEADGEEGSPSSVQPNSPPCSALKKRRLDEAISVDNPPCSVLPNTPPAAHGCTLPSGACSPPPGFPRTPQHFASRHDDDSTNWKTARKLLEEKLVEREAEIAALRKQLEETEGELATVKRTLKAERESAQATTAMLELLGAEERALRRAEHALEGYRRWKDSRGKARPRRT